MQIDKQKIVLLIVLVGVAVGGFMFFQSSPEAEVAAQPVAEAPVVAETQVQPQPEVQPAAPVEAAPAETLGASSSGLGR